MELNGVKCLFTAKTPRGLIPRMQTFTRGKRKAGLHVFQESVAEFHCFRGLGCFSELYSCGFVRRTYEFAKQAHFTFLLPTAFKYLIGVLRTDMPTRSFVASYNNLGDRYTVVIYMGGQNKTSDGTAHCRFRRLYTVQCNRTFEVM